MSCNEFTKARREKGKLMNGYGIFVANIILCFPIVAHALNCDPLDPRGKVTKEAETTIVAAVSGLFEKLIKLDTGFQRKVKETVDNLHGQLPKTERHVIKEKTIYLYCEALNEAKVEQKMPLINSLEKVLELPETKGGVEELETSHGIISATAITSISYQCDRATKSPCPPLVELKRRAIRAAQAIAAEALAQQLTKEIESDYVFKGGRIDEEKIHEIVKIRLKGIRYDSPVEQGDQISIRAQLSGPSK
jgi:hypothetical protein